MNANNAPLAANARRFALDVDPDEFADAIRSIPSFNPTNVVRTNAPAFAAEIEFDATPAALDAYIAYFGLDADDRDDIFTPID